MINSSGGPKAVARDGGGRGAGAATHAEIRERQREQRLLMSTAVSPAQTAAVSAAGSLFSPGKLVADPVIVCGRQTRYFI